MYKKFMRFIAMLISVLLLALPLASCSVEKHAEGIFAEISTTRGVIEVQLFYDKAPLTVINFVGLAEGTLDASKGIPFYDGLTFHRVISTANGDTENFMIQGGDPAGNGTGGPGYTFPDEISDELVFDKAGKLAMANAGADTNGSQFFITLAPTAYLDGKHTIFGEVTSGMDIAKSVVQGDTIKSIKIKRYGADAEKFSCTQADFDRELINVRQAQEKEQERLAQAAQDYFITLYPDYIQSSSGLLYTFTQVGTGIPASSGNITVNYKNYLFVLDDKPKLIDDSYTDGEPLTFTLKSGAVIPGFDELVTNMCVGEKRVGLLPPELAYGTAGAGGGIIPPNSWIIFEVERVDDILNGGFDDLFG